MAQTDQQSWSVDPFVLTHRGDHVLGRGTADMKGFLAAVLAAAPHFAKHCRGTPIHLAFSYDEEVGCRGVRGLLERLREDRCKPLGCIIGEPTGMSVASAHKGKRAYRCRIRGRAGHSALPHLSVNAVEFAAEIATLLRRTGQDLSRCGQRDERFEPPYTTIHTGRLNGGDALNVVPNYAELDFEIRNLPCDDPDRVFEAVRCHAERELIPCMREVAPEATMEWLELASYPALLPDPESDWLNSMACELTGIPVSHAVSFGTEGGLFQAVGIPTIICGPGSIENAHKANEYVELMQLERCLEFLLALAETYPDWIEKSPKGERVAA